MLNSIRDLNHEELISWMKSHKIPGFRGKQIFDWINKGVVSFEEMKNVPQNLQKTLGEHFVVANTKIVEVLKSKSDATRKYLLELNDGNIIECVWMKYKHGNTICVSTQVGCRMGCTFCASTLHGLSRQLTAGEMLGQILTLQNDTDERISNIVLMGSGEPLDNYDEVLKFLHMVNHDKGLNISMRNITLSTCGLIDKIELLMKEKLQITLAISLHSTQNDQRNELMPVNKKYPIEDLLSVCRRYTKETGRRITFEYALIAGKNDTEEEARSLGKLLKGMMCHVNLIPINPVEERGFKATSQNGARAFQGVLKKYHIEATIRRELGADIDAACGQLRNKHIKTT